MIITAGIMIVAGIVGSIYFPVLQAHYFAIGIILTTALNIIKVIWLERTTERVASMSLDEQEIAGNHIRFQYLLRLFLTGAVLVFAALIAIPSLLWGAVAGIFTYHPAKYALWFVIKAENADNISN